MFKMVRMSFFRNDTYRPIPQYTTPNTKIRPGSRKWFAPAIFIIFLLFSGAIWALFSSLFTIPYSPLMNYQNLNPPDLVDQVWKHSSPPHDKRAVVTTLYSDSFVMGVAVLGHSVRAANVSARLLMPYLEDRLSPQALCIASAAGWTPVPVPYIPPPHDGKGIHHRFWDQYTKLNIWALDKQGVERAVYLDADTLVRRNFDELFESPFNFAAVPDAYVDSRGFPITFNAGVLAFRPSSAVLEVMRERIATAVFPLKQAEQSFLNLFFSTNVLRLPYAYNANLIIKKSSPAMWEGMKKEMRIVHYTMIKPFLDDTPGSPDIPTEEMQRKAIDRAARYNSGEYFEEVGWWHQAYDRMMKDTRAKFEACSG